MDFLSGTYFKRKCRLRFTDYSSERNCAFVKNENPSLDNDYVFCKTEYLRILAQNVSAGQVSLPDKFKLFTHNSDINIDSSTVNLVLNLFPTLGHWYTQNLLSQHEKVSPIPIGIANPKWSHGNIERFENIIKEKDEKSNMVYINFNVKTNPVERNYCLTQLRSSVTTSYPNLASIADHASFVNSTQDQYLRDIKKSYFVISPNGNGIDCHKTWEALYMRSVPIVTRSVMAERFKKMGIPLLVIEDWSCFKNLELSDKLYDELWGSFNPEKLNLDFFLSKP
tara:strand:- start:13143 stop:13985 length:843 start_codon:yes stop_codon:yes gene_type:complete